MIVTLRSKLVGIVAVAALACANGGCSGKGQVEAQAGGIALRNVLTGLVCGVAREDRRICFETKSIPVVGESRCGFGGDVQPCTWYGYSFDYELSEDGATLQCTTESDHVAAIGNADNVKQTRESRYELPLTGKHGHFFNPQFSILPVPQHEMGAIKHVHTRCSHQGKVVLDVTFELKYPER